MTRTVLNAIASTTTKSRLYLLDIDFIDLLLPVA